MMSNDTWSRPQERMQRLEMHNMGHRGERDSLSAGAIRREGPSCRTPSSGNVHVSCDDEDLDVMALQHFQNNNRPDVFGRLSTFQQANGFRIAAQWALEHNRRPGCAHAARREAGRAPLSQTCHTPTRAALQTAVCSLVGRRRINKATEQTRPPTVHWDVSPLEDRFAPLAPEAGSLHIFPRISRRANRAPAPRCLFWTSRSKHRMRRRMDLIALGIYPCLCMARQLLHCSTLSQC